MSDYKNFWSDVYIDIIESLKENTEKYDIVEEEVSFKNLNLPCINIIPTNSNYVSNSEYNDIIDILFIYQKKNNYYKCLKEVEENIKYIQEKLKKNKTVINSRVDELENFASDTNNTLKQIILVRFEIQKLKKDL